MSGPLRSKQGCWTCRLRRKKCDEGHPSCATCESLTITCYGYGAKPEWMDGGAQEKEMASSIKQIVKHTSRRKDRFNFTAGRLKQKAKDGTKIDEKVVNRTSESNMESHGTSSSSEQFNGSSVTTQSPQPEANTSLGGIGPTDAFLLMHFLDNVFPLQYPAYHPSMLAGGRGWFLALLLQAKPLYHAALALAAYHHGTVIYAAAQKLQGTSQPDIIDENGLGTCPMQEKHIQICLVAFQESIEKSKNWMKDNQGCSVSLGLLGCAVQLTYFELFAGRGDTWQIHLRAATDIFAQNYLKQAAHLHLTETLEEIKQSEWTKNFGAELFSEEVAAFRFFCGILIWLDVLSCVTTGRRPRLLHFHDTLLRNHSALKLENTIGCRNWAVLQIGQIAMLHEWKMGGIMYGALKPADLEEKAEIIRQSIKDGLMGDQLECLEITEHSDVQFCPRITHIFALALTVYLHLVVYGFETSSGTLDATMAEAMTFLRAYYPTQNLNAIIFPLYIFGCNARPEDEDFFRVIFSSPPVLERSMEHREKLLPLMENVWRMRRTSLTAWSWQDNLLLSEYNLLLV